jgi:hypothetical protein
VQPQWPVTNQFLYPVAGSVGVGGTTNLVPDQNENRPPRINQFSIGIQGEITRNFGLEASYVGNRGVWEQGAAFATASPYGFFSQISPQNLRSTWLVSLPWHWALLLGRRGLGQLEL